MLNSSQTFWKYFCPPPPFFTELENCGLREKGYVYLKEIISLFFHSYFFRHVDEILRQRIPGSFVRSYGSSMTGIGLKSSGLNLDFQIPPETAPHEALIKAFQTLTLKTDEFSNVNPDFTAKIPVVSFDVGGKKCSFEILWDIIWIFKSCQKGDVFLHEK